MENEHQSLVLVKMIASELGYTMMFVQHPDMGVKEILVFEREQSHFSSFVGENKVEIALQWLRRQA